MKKLLNAIKKNLEVTIKQTGTAEKDVDYKKAEKYIPFFKLIESSKISAVVLYDMYKGNMYYVSETIYDLLGFPGQKSKPMDNIWFRERFHPDDYYIFLAGIKIYNYLLTLPIERRKDFKQIYDCRVRNEQNAYIRIIVQDFLLELDAKGNPWLDMKLIDLAPIQDLESPAKIVHRNIHSGETIFSFENNFEETNQISEREKQVLDLISKGLRSQEIADKLFISTNTVNNHRRNMLRKLNVSNSSEAVKFASKLGII